MRLQMDESRLRQDISESWRRMVPWGQSVSSAYRVDDEGYLVEGGTAALRYMPITRPEIPGELAKVRSADDAPAFARCYGLLGFARADRTPGEGWFLARPTPPVEEWQALLEQRRQDATAPGDPVDWFLAHATTVRTIVELGHLLGTDDERALERYLDQYRTRLPEQSAEEQRFYAPGGPGAHVPPGMRGEEAILLRVADRGARRPGLSTFPINAPMLALGRRIVAVLLNQNLERGRRVVDRETLQSRFGLGCLLDVVYWHLADAVAGRRLRQCLACGAVFTITDDRMKYCPPPMGLDGASRCMNRAKVRRWRQGDATPRRKGKRQRRPRR
jgi:hypothetical protein